MTLLVDTSVWSLALRRDEAGDRLLLEGGQLWKIRMPLPAGDADDVLMPESIEKIAEEMRRSYHSGESWWRDGPALKVPVTGGANG